MFQVTFNKVDFRLDICSASITLGFILNLLILVHTRLYVIECTCSNRRFTSVYGVKGLLPHDFPLRCPFDKPFKSEVLSQISWVYEYTIGHSILLTARGYRPRRF